ncbi:hypothetical protein LJR225_002886 [Phenylobacterium sp. LjRoot225]|uniref:hypothetical protein n=1 Tax=Phenylobacterium sp. LjRoot225 TaxID=3342285 RepID=UPI003ECE5B3B
MSLTSNFDFCVELGLAPVKAIFHLALKNEALFPHNIGPFDRTYSGRAMSISVRLIDDNDSPADLTFQDSAHIVFTLPFEVTAEIPDAPDPALARVTLRSAVQVPGALATWQVDGKDQLGVDFAGVEAGAVNVPAVSGLPALDSARFENAIHERYDDLPTHTFAQAGNTLVLYDGVRDTSLSPPNKSGNPPITAVLEPHGASQFLKVTLPIHATVPTAVFAQYGVVTFWREVVATDSSVSVNMGTAPADPALATVVAFDGSHPAEGLIVTQLTPLVNAQLAGFGTITEPWFTEASAKAVIAAEAAAYLADKRYPMYTPDSGDPDEPLATPKGFLLPADGVLAILMNRRSGTEADDVPPDNFLGGGSLALAVGRAKLDEIIAASIDSAFPDLKNGSQFIETEEGDADLKRLTVTPSDPGAHDEARGHLWAEGEAEVHIDCWPDPDVTFSGPIFLNVVVTETDETCSIEIDPEMGEFDAGQSCCDVFVDLIIPIVGWIMLGVIEGMIDDVGGRLAEEFADDQAREIEAIPPVVVGVAELQSCLEGLEISSQGLVFPGKLRVRREGTSFEDLAESGDLPRP